MPSDELWMELAEFDARLGDGIWDGAVPPDDAPSWSHRLGTLIAAARGPAAPDELAREDRILADMLAVTSDGADGEPPARHRVRMIGGVAAVKAGTAIVTALGAAAATTGLVVTLMAPEAGPERPPVDTSTIESPTLSGGGTSSGPSDASDDDPGAVDGRSTDSCAVLRIDCSPTTTTTAGSGSAGGAGGSGSLGATPGGAATSPGSSASSPSLPTTPQTTATPEPTGPADTPGNSGSAPGRPESPGNSGATPGPPESPGNSGSAPGRPESPGNSGATPGRPESPGNSGSAPGRPSSPGNSGAAPGRPESPGNRGSQAGGVGEAVDAAHGDTPVDSRP